ncbi:MAG: hypothetical protein KDK02_14755 [Rhodobacteraceae bacterium]|nr:hypothetical protein [Paracoccaceae bacterium]
MDRVGRTAAFGLFVCLAVAAGCSKKEERVLFDGHYFPAKAAAVDRKATLADFVVSVKDASVSLDGARAAGGYEGTRYCIANYGTSRIDWTVGPDTEPQNLVIDKDTLNFQGTCLRP